MVKTIGRVLSASLSLLLLFGSMSALAGNLSDFPIPDLSAETLPPECYGILTDEYQVFYTQDETGAISMDQESLADFQALLRNDEALQKVIQDRATARNEPLTFFDVVAQANEIQNTLQPALLLKEMDRLPTVKLTAAAAVKATGDLQNFTHALNSERYVAILPPILPHISNVSLFICGRGNMNPFGRLLIRWPSHGLPAYIR